MSLRMNTGKVTREGICECHAFSSDRHAVSLPGSSSLLQLPAWRTIRKLTRFLLFALHKTRKGFCFLAQHVGKDSRPML